MRHCLKRYHDQETRIAHAGMMDFFRPRILLFLFTLLVSISIWADPGLRYTVRMPEPHTHYFELELKISEVAGPLSISMPAWTPGSYAIRDYAGLVEGFEATDGKGGKVAFAKTSKNTWRIDPGKATSIKVRYRVYANEHSVRSPYLDAKHAAIIPAGVFMTLVESDPPVTVQFVPYSDWEVITTTLDRVDGDPWTRVAPNRDILYDTPVEIGNHEVYAFEAAGIPHELAIYGEGNYDPEQLVTDLRAIAEETTAMFGDNPCDRYTFILHNTPNGYGGLEHLNSTSLIYGRWRYQPQSQYRVFLGLISHEYFHLYNVKRIRPVGLSSFDYSREAYTTGLWIMEGFTAYYDDLLLLRAGLMTEQSYLGIAGGNVSNIENREGNRVQAVAEASYDAWIKYYKSNENSSNSTISYYSKGAVLAMLLDLEILQQTGGKRRLDDVMRALYDDWKKRPERGFTEMEFQKLVSKTAGTDMDYFFEGYVYGTDSIDYDRYLKAVGLELEDDYDRNRGPWMGLSMSGAKVNRVVRDGPAWDSGINSGDEILAVNGWRFPGDWSTLLERYAVGDILEIMVSREERIEYFTLQIGRYPRHRYRLSQIDDPNPEQERLYRTWLSLAAE